MLDAGYIGTLPDNLVEIYTGAEADILADMARRISTYDYFIPSAMHQKQMLEASGMIEADILERLSGLTGKNTAELTDLLNTAGAKAIKADTEIYKLADIYRASKVDTAAINAILRSGLRQTLGEFRNLARTSARLGSKQFMDILDRAWAGVSSGAFDTDTAIRNAVKALSREGLTAIEFRNPGKNPVTMSLEGAVRRMVVTGVNQAAMKAQEELADELDVDLVETTAHAGARPEHAAWQGQVFSRSGKSRKYPDFRRVTGYGTGEGLGGWNCRHSFYPYVDGTERAYSRQELQQYKAKTIKYNGNLLTEYEASQEQRYLEQQIRRWKREEAAMAAAGQDTAEAAGYRRKWQKQLNTFSVQTGLKIQRARTFTG